MRQAMICAMALSVVLVCGVTVAEDKQVEGENLLKKVGDQTVGGVWSKTPPPDPADGGKDAGVDGGTDGGTPESPTKYIPCGGERTFQISGRSDATRTVTEIILLDPDVGIPDQDEVLNYCQTNNARMRMYAIRSAKAKALADCRQHGKNIAAGARCKEMSDAGASSAGAACPYEPTIKNLTCSLTDDDTPACDWSASSAEHVGFKKKKITWKSGRGRKGGCRDIYLRQVRVTYIVRVNYVYASGSVTLACPRENDTPSPDSGT